MDQCLSLETLPSGASQYVKERQQSKARSYAATLRHRNVTLKRNPLSSAQQILESRKDSPRTRNTFVYRIGPSPQYLRRNAIKKSIEYVDTEPNQDSSEPWQLAKMFSTGPQSLLNASTTDPFGTYPMPNQAGQVVPDQHKKDSSNIETTAKGNHSTKSLKFHNRPYLRHAHISRESGKVLSWSTIYNLMKYIVLRQRSAIARQNSLLFGVAHPLSILGEGRFDPFNVFAVQDVKPHIHEILDHGKLFHCYILKF
jgi:hypothetical protein